MLLELLLISELVDQVESNEISDGYPESELRRLFLKIFRVAEISSRAPEINVL